MPCRLIVNEYRITDLWESNGCDIPGQTKKGFCTEAGNCAAYQKLLNDSGDNSIEREDFIQQLQCGKFDGDRVCCPDSDNYQIGVYEDAVMCGQAAYSYRIRGGMIADIDEFPWTAMLLRMHRKLVKDESCAQICNHVMFCRKIAISVLSLWWCSDRETFRSNGSALHRAEGWRFKAGSIVSMFQIFTVVDIQLHLFTLEICTKFSV